MADFGGCGELWVKSSYSSDGPNCIEVVPKYPGHIVVRDSKDVSGPRLTFPCDGWGDFIRDIRADRI